MKLDLEQFDKSLNTTRGNPYHHILNDNVVMNSANLFYGKSKSGKTRTLIQSFAGAEFIYLDFDRNYADIVELVEKNGGHYYNGKNAVAVLRELLRGNIEKTVVIIDSLQDVKKLMLKLRYGIVLEEDSALAENIVGLMMNGAVGIDADDTAAWFTHTISRMVNDSNSINFIHHTTDNNQGSKLAGNSSAYKSKFDTTYVIINESESTYYKLEAGRSNIPKNIVGSQRNYTDAMDWIKEKFTSRGATKMNGIDLKEKVTKRSPEWVKEFNLQKLRDDVFNREIVGQSFVYTLKDVV